jgi:hypothetical protein
VRTVGSGSSDSSIPGVRFVGRKRSFFCTSKLFGTTLRLPLAVLADEDEGVDAVVLLVGKAVRNGERADRLRRIRVAGEELLEFRGLRGVGRTRDDGLQQITKVLAGPDGEELE